MTRKELLKSNIDVLERSIRRIVEKASQSTVKKRKPAEIKMSTVIKKVDQYTESDNPMVQREMARRVKASQPHVCPITRKKLDKKRTKKKTVKRLSAAMIAKRKERGKPFSELVSGV